MCVCAFFCICMRHSATKHLRGCSRQLMHSTGRLKITFFHMCPDFFAHPASTHTYHTCNTTSIRKAQGFCTKKTKTSERRTTARPRGSRDSLFIACGDEFKIVVKSSCSLFMVTLDLYLTPSIIDEIISFSDDTRIYEETKQWFNG